MPPIHRRAASRKQGSAQPRKTNKQTQTQCRNPAPSPSPSPSPSPPCWRCKFAISITLPSLCSIRHALRSQLRALSTAQQEKKGSREAPTGHLFPPPLPPFLSLYPPLQRQYPQRNALVLSASERRPPPPALSPIAGRRTAKKPHCFWLYSPRRPRRAGTAALHFAVFDPPPPPPPAARPPLHCALRLALNKCAVIGLLRSTRGTRARAWHRL